MKSGLFLYLRLSQVLLIEILLIVVGIWLYLVNKRFFVEMGFLPEFALMP